MIESKNTHKDDAQLISAYLEGDENALGVLVDRYLKNVYNFAFKLTSDMQAAEDITQDSFIKAWQHVRGFRRGKSFQTWIFAIVRNTAIDWLRRKKDVPFSSFENELGENNFVENLTSDSPLSDELIVRAEDAQFVRNLLTQLDPLYREVIVLRYTSNLTFEEIGTILRKPLHTVKSQHRRALIALRKALHAKPA